MFITLLALPLLLALAALVVRGLSLFELVAYYMAALLVSSLLVGHTT